MYNTQEMDNEVYKDEYSQCLIQERRNVLL